MQKPAALLLLLLLGCCCSRSLQMITDSLFSTQENFDHEQFLGTWYDVAIATTSPQVQRMHLGTPISRVEVENRDGQLKATVTGVMNGMCRVMEVDHQNTTTPGRYFFNLQALQLDVDAYVVKCNYSHFAFIATSNRRPTGETSLTLKLYSRNRTVSDDVLAEFKALVVQQEGLSEEMLMVKPDRGDCVPGEVVMAPRGLNRHRRDAASIAEEEGSGMDDAFFNATEACSAPMDIGPCYALKLRFFYNATAKTCQAFYYGGCAGNSNNFDTEKECLQRCRTEAVCRLPMEAKPCSGQPSTWSFDSSAGLCVAYKLGFCQTNANKFYSKAECDEFCGVAKDGNAEIIED
ncbi:protein AMBP-like [Nelusetta ayraudi]|uniref:protein AMBP-like n=1 Tax=Nelusetta ayraudi TaxID=303726 RepID=UPI003F6ED18E